MPDPTFVLLASSSAIPPSPALHLLPVSLGPSSAPYSTTTAPISAYFFPRPCPPGISGVPAGQQIASFRGRQIVGQTIRVPRGYRGVVLSASKRPDLGGFEHRNDLAEESKDGRRRVKEGSRNLTPSSSAASVSGTSVSTLVDEEPEAGVRRSSRRSSVPVKGAGQVALSRPKTRQAPKRVERRMRFRLDSDEEDKDEGEGERCSSTSTCKPNQAPTTSVTPARTPCKRRRTEPHLTRSPRSPSFLHSTSLPAIVIQEPTPRKAPLPPPIRSLRKGDRAADYVPGALARGEFEDREEPVEDVRDEDAKAEHGEGRPALAGVESTIVPSPATEDDFPPFPVEEKSKHLPPPLMYVEEDVAPITATAEGGKGDMTGNSIVSGPVRALRAIASFESFTLWTPDAPLAGWRADEGFANPSVKGEQSDELVEQEAEESMDVKGEAARLTSGAKAEDGGEISSAGEGIKLRPGWWRAGGAGEGGDEVVRAMGEWLGLVEVLNEPVYLDEVSEDETDEDGDENGIVNYQEE